MLMCYSDRLDDLLMPEQDDLTIPVEDMMQYLAEDDTPIHPHGITDEGFDAPAFLALQTGSNSEEILVH